ncbi:hypothetical protein J6I39_05970 [bacterium]|nr:hypothetical protein [bacterium]
MTVELNINYLWNSGTEQEWKYALEKYFDLVKSSNVEIEKELDNLDSENVKNMTVSEFYNFLHDKYFVWKYTQANRLRTTRNSLVKYLEDDNIVELEEIHNLIFKYNPENISNLLRTTHRIKGLGVAGASGLLSLLFPKYFGTVDQFVVQRLLEVENLKEHFLLEKMKQDNLTEKDGTILIEIMREKANELNKKFKTSEWTPRKIDKILWSIDR